MSVSIARVAVLFTAVTAACGDDPARVTIEPVGMGPCGHPAGATGVKLTAYTRGGEITKAVALDESLAIADFPASTMQFGVEVLVENGEVGAAGKTIPFDFAALPSGPLPIAMLPIDGFCAVGPMLQARARPLVARAGSGVMVIGGTTGGVPNGTGEFYDPATGTFESIELPEAVRDPVEGLAGVVLATLPDGRVVLTGGVRGVISVFDPVSRTFGPVLAISRRAFHAAIAIDPTHLLVSGGCANVAGGTCDPTPLRSSLELGLEGMQVGAPNLPAGSIHEGAQLFDLGLDVDGVQRFVVAGGFGDAGAAARFGIDDATGTHLATAGSQATLLDGGAVMTGFARDGDAASGAATVITPGGDVRTIAPAPALAGARIVGLEDGTVVAFGNDPLGVDPAGRVETYAPTSDTWQLAPPNPAGDQPGLLDRPSTIRLADGSVLVIAETGSWLYRPSLVGPSSGAIAVLPNNPIRGASLVIPDPAAVVRTIGFVLSASTDRFDARALVGGARFAYGSVAATIHGVVGSVALIGQQRAPGQAIVAVIANGQPARLQRDAGQVVCTGKMVNFEPASTIRLAIAGGNTSIVVDDVVVLSCSTSFADDGAWGIGAYGAGSSVAIDAVSVARQP